MRTLLTGPAIVLVLAAAPGSAASSPRSGLASTVVYRAPVSGPLRVLRGFDPPATRYGAGHLGVDLAIPADGLVHAAGPGVVRFAGAVAGRGVVVILHPDGISTEYEPVSAVIRAGQPVVAGSVLGRVRGVHVGCPATNCLHWGARRGDQYLDPLSLLRPLGVVRLVPWGWSSGSALSG